MLEIEDLQVQVAGKEILKQFSLKVNSGEIHAIMGPNGAGKSTLAKVLSGHPDYEITGGDVRFNGASILELDPEERAHLGLFMSFQYPIEIPGVTTQQFLRGALNSNRKARKEQELSEQEFNKLLEEKMKLLEMRSEFKFRGVNEGYSGGEKKRNEILQMAMLDPIFSILDETDSGLDIDAMRIVARGVNKLHSKNKSILLITHYQRLLDYIVPNYIHVMIGGKIVTSGGPELAMELESKGYDWLEKCPEENGSA